LKEPSDLENDYKHFIALLQEAAKMATHIASQQHSQRHSTRNFRRAHSAIQQSHHIANTVAEALNNKQYCTAVFLDIAQAYDKVWHSGLLFKIKKLLPSH
jgi:hypothetical protein